MSPKFTKRFEIDISLEEAKQRFINRAYNLVFNKFFYRLTDSQRYAIHGEVISSLGDKYEYYKTIPDHVGDDFLRNLQALERFYQECPIFYRDELYSLINRLLAESEVDLGIRWENFRFVKSGAKLLDDGLVNDVIKWIDENKYLSVKAPFEKGLEHFLHATKRPELLYDVITDMYEALEAVSQIITGRPDKDLSANRELFVSKVNASSEYKKILAEYINYANDYFRHAIKEGRTRPKVTVSEVESFIYMTGLFIRLAMQ